MSRLNARGHRLISRSPPRTSQLRRPAPRRTPRRRLESAFDAGAEHPAVAATARLVALPSHGEERHVRRRSRCLEGGGLVVRPGHTDSESADGVPLAFDQRERLELAARSPGPYDEARRLASRRGFTSRRATARVTRPGRRRSPRSVSRRRLRVRWRPRRRSPPRPASRVRRSPRGRRRYRSGRSGPFR